GEEAAARLQEARERVDDRHGVDPAAQEAERHVDRREEQRQEHRQLHHRAGLHRPETHRDAACPQEPGAVDEHAERGKPDEVDAGAADGHADDRRHDRQHHGDEGPATERCEGVAGDEPAPVRRGEQEAPREPALEVAGDAEAREDTAEGGRLEQHEDELEPRVAGPVAEARHVAHLLETARERREEEERKGDLREHDRRRRERVVKRPPGDAERDRAKRCVRSHVRVNLVRSAQADASSPAVARAAPIANASASASPSQPVTIRLRTPSIRYETGLAVARPRNHPTDIRFRGAFIDEMKSATKKTGKKPITDSLDPERSATSAPSDPKASTTSSVRARSTSTPAAPALKPVPVARPTMR